MGTIHSVRIVIQQKQDSIPAVLIGKIVPSELKKHNPITNMHFASVDNDINKLK